VDWRAYTDAIAAALVDAPVVERVPETQLTVLAEYGDAERIRRWADGEGHETGDAEYGEAVRFTLRLPTAAADTARDAVRDLTQGRADVEG
jgi:putative IMPACT (imprinted ancient) family translation regulator